MKDPVEVQLPGGDSFFIILRVEKLRDRVSFTPLDDVSLDLGHSPVIGRFVSGSPGISSVGLTHVVNCPIASNTD